MYSIPSYAMRTDTAHGFPSISIVERCCCVIPKSDITLVTLDRWRRGTCPAPERAGRVVQRMARGRNRPEARALHPSPGPPPVKTPLGLDRHDHERTLSESPSALDPGEYCNPDPGFPRLKSALDPSRETARGFEPWQ